MNLKHHRIGLACIALASCALASCNSTSAKLPNGFAFHDGSALQNAAVNGLDMEYDPSTGKMKISRLVINQDQTTGPGKLAGASVLNALGGKLITGLTAVGGKLINADLSKAKSADALAAKKVDASTALKSKELDLKAAEQAPVAAPTQ